MGKIFNTIKDNAYSLTGTGILGVLGSVFAISRNNTADENTEKFKKMYKNIRQITRGSNIMYAIEDASITPHIFVSSRITETQRMSLVNHCVKQFTAIFIQGFQMFRLSLDTDVVAQLKVMGAGGKKYVSDADFDNQHEINGDDPQAEIEKKIGEIFASKLKTDNQREVPSHNGRSLFFDPTPIKIVYNRVTKKEGEEDKLTEVSIEVIIAPEIHVMSDEDFESLLFVKNYKKRSSFFYRMHELVSGSINAGEFMFPFALARDRAKAMYLERKADKNYGASDESGFDMIQHLTKRSTMAEFFNILVLDPASERELGQRLNYDLKKKAEKNKLLNLLKVLFIAVDYREGDEGYVRSYFNQIGTYVDIKGSKLKSGDNLSKSMDKIGEIIKSIFGQGGF